MAHGGTLAPVRPLLALMAAAALVVGIAPTVAAQAGPLPEAGPTVTVTPDTGLVDEQVVAVHGEGFADSRGYLTYVECAADGDLFSDNCRGAETGAEVPSDVHADGSFDGTYRVDAQFYTDDGDLIDCRLAPGCVLRMDSAFEPVDLPLTFDPSAPLAPPPVLTATPDTDLTDGTRVQLELTGFRPGGWLFLYLCPGTSRSADCAFGDELLEPLVADDAGRIATQVILRAVNDAQSGARFDCREVDCHLVATEGQSLNNNVAARVAFDPDAPLAPEPSITVTPSTGLVDGQAVDVAVEGLIPGEHFSVVECLVPTRAHLYYTCDPHGWTDVVAGDGGSYATRMTVRDHFPDEIRDEEIDCRVMPCAIGLARMIDMDAVLVPRVALSFASANGALVPEPIAASPAFTG